MASPPFDLTANPFHVLSVSLRSRKDEIAAAHDLALGDGNRSEAELSRALQALLVPRSRLEAELSWLPGLAPADADAVMRMLGARDFAACNGRLDHLLGLDAANLAAHLCGLEVGRPVHAERILVAYGNVDETRLAKMIDESRVVSGFPRLDRSMLGPALAALRKAHGEAALGWLKRQPDPGARMLALVEAGFDDEHRAPIMGELAGGYDRWTAPALQRIRDEIATEIVRMRADPEAAGAVACIADALERWDAISQPMQVLEQAKGHDEPRSRELYRELRTLCIWLSNERNVHAPALAISRALLKTLPELPSVALELERDIAALERLVDDPDDPVIAPLVAVLGAHHEHARDNARDLLTGGFGPDATGWARQLFDVFQRAIAGAGASEAERLWRFLRASALKLNEQRETRHAALRLMEGMLAFAPQPSPDLSERLQQDLLTIRGNVYVDDVNDLVRRGMTAPALDKIDMAFQLGISDAQGRVLMQTRAKLQKNGATASPGQALSHRASRRVAALIAAALVGAVVALQAERPRPAPTNLPGTSLLTASPPVPAVPPDLAPERWTLTESPPQPGTDNLLTLPELRYCEFQQSRLESLRDRIDASTEGRFDAAADDWNARCGSYRYWPNDRDTVDSQLASYRQDILTSADAMLVSWTPKESEPAPSAPAAAASPAKKSPATPAKPAAAPVRYDPLTRSGAIEVQAELQARGFYEGKVDGHWGAASKAALMAWKTSAGLAPDAAWDAATERALMGD